MIINETKRNKPFIVNLGQIEILSKITKTTKSNIDIKDLIPVQLVNNLDILASTNEKFQGAQVTRNMITMSFDDYLNYQGDFNLYLAQIPLFRRVEAADVEYRGNKKQILSRLNNEISSDSLFSKPEFIDQRLQSINLWASKGYSDSGCHYDSFDNFLIVLNGQKFIWLSKSTRQWDKWMPIHDEAYNHLKPNMNYRQKGAKYIVLKQNQILFIPKSWLHRVISINDCIAINIWFGKIESIKKNNFCLRYLMNEITKQEVEKTLEKIILQKLEQYKLDKKNIFHKVAKSNQFQKLNFSRKYRTIDSYSYHQEISFVIYNLFYQPSSNMIEFLQFLMEKFVANTDQIINQLPQLSKLIISIKLTEFTQKDQLIFVDGQSLLESYKNQQLQKIQKREQFFNIFWKIISQQTLDELEDIQKEFYRKVSIKSTSQHLI